MIISRIWEPIGEASLSLPPKFFGKDTLPSSPAVPTSSPVLDTSGAADATATIESEEEGEVATLAS